MIDCMTLDHMIYFASLLGDIVTVFGDFEMVRIDAETATTWWYRAAEPTAAGAPPSAPQLCMGPGPVQG